MTGESFFASDTWWWLDAVLVEYEEQLTDALILVAFEFSQFAAQLGGSSVVFVALIFVVVAGVLHVLDRLATARS
jgi:uncharacterized membrane protein